MTQWELNPRGAEPGKIAGGIYCALLSRQEAEQVVIAPHGTFRHAATHWLRSPGLNDGKRLVAQLRRVDPITSVSRWPPAKNHQRRDKRNCAHICSLDP